MEIAGFDSSVGRHAIPYPDTQKMQLWMQEILIFQILNFYLFNATLFINLNEGTNIWSL